MRLTLTPSASGRLRISLLLALTGWAGAAWAGGPGDVTPGGRPLRWDVSQPLRYQIDRGSLGTRRHETLIAMAGRAFQSWVEVPTAALRVEAAGELAQDVNGRNVVSFLDSREADAPVAVLLDADGTILDLLLGDGAGRSTFGFGQPYPDPWEPARIASAVIVIAAPLHEEYADGYLYSTVVHEVGHALGLDHSQINREQLHDGDPANDALAPVMSYFRGPNETGGLHLDDRAWISWLYPSAEFAGGTGTIRGRVLLPDGVTGLAGINVIARRMDDPHATAVSSVSGYVFGNEGSGSPDPARMGEFLIPGLPPGSYTVEVASLDGETVHRIRDGFLVGGRKFWREGSSAQDPPDSLTPIVVNAGRTVTGVDFLLNGESGGEPRLVSDREPNQLPGGQAVTLPALISGQVDGREGEELSAPIEDEALPEELQDVYRITLTAPAVVTAILSAADPSADLDLYLVATDNGVPYAAAASLHAGTPPETLQFHLPAGRFYFGVHAAGGRGSAYSLRLLATAAPPPATPEVAWINYLIVGDITPTGAMVRWQTTLPAPSDLHYNAPLREIGSPARTQDHALPLTDLRPGAPFRTRAFSQRGDLSDFSDAGMRAATPPLEGGAPRIVVSQRAMEILPSVVEVQLTLQNAGTGDARNLRIDSLVLPSGWKPFAAVIADMPLPQTFEVGGVGAGGAGALVLRLVRVSGSAPPKVTAHGSYRDAAGRTLSF